MAERFFYIWCRRGSRREPSPLSMLCLGSLGLYGHEVCEVASVERLDVGSVAEHLLFGGTHEHVGRLLEKFGSLRRIGQQQKRHHNVGRHVIETATEEVVFLLVSIVLHLLDALLVKLNELGNAALECL